MERLRTKEIDERDDALAGDTFQSIGNLVADVVLRLQARKKAPGVKGDMPREPAITRPGEERRGAIGNKVGSLDFRRRFRNMMGEHTSDPHGKECSEEERTASKGVMLPRDWS